MKNSIYLIVLLCLSSCSKGEHPTIACMNVRGSLDIVYLNKQGENLLDESTPNRYSVQKMKLFFLKGGEKIEVYNPMSDSPRGITLMTDSPVRIQVAANVGYKDDLVSDDGTVKVGQSTALLQLDENLTDTVKTEWESGTCYLLITKAWYNRKLVYDVKARLPSLAGKEGFVITK